MANGTILRKAEANGYVVVCFDSHDDYDGVLVTQYYVNMYPAGFCIADVMSGEVAGDMEASDFGTAEEALARFDALLLSLASRPTPKVVKTKGQLLQEWAERNGIPVTDLPMAKI